MTIRALAAVGLAALLGACSSDPDPIAYLGPVTAASYTAPPAVAPGGATVCPAAGAADEAPTLTASACAGELSGVTASSGLATEGSEVLVTVASGVARRAVQDDGCAAATGTDEADDGLTGPIAQGDVGWVARSESVEVRQGDQGVASCAVAGVRALAAVSDRAWAVTAKGIVPLRWTGQGCEVEAAWKVPGTALAITASTQGVWVAQGGCEGAAPSIVRYDLAGAEVTTAPVLAGDRLGVCSIRGLAERDDQLLVVDGSCRRVVVVDAVGGAVVGRLTTPVGEAPTAIAPTATGALVLTTSPGEGTTVGRLHAIDL